MGDGLAVGLQAWNSAWTCDLPLHARCF